MYITIDDYYPIEFYNECLSALKNNGINYKEYINVKNFKWYIQVPFEPIMINYDKIPDNSVKYLINKIQTVKEQDEYLYYRRNDGIGKSAMLKYTENQALKEARLSDYAVFFNTRNKEQLEQITRELPIKIYYFGRYYNKYKLCLCSNKMILNYIDKNQILLEKTGISEVGMFEAELNYKIFKNTDMLDKYSDTQYFENGIYKDVKIRDGRSYVI